MDYSHGRSHDSFLACLHDMVGMLCSNDLMDLLDIFLPVKTLFTVVDVVDDLDFMHG